MGAQPTFDTAEQYRRLSREWFRERRPDSPFIPRDWADDLIKGAAGWIESSDIPEWLHLRIATVPNVLLQLPRPDNRWVLQFREVFFGPFDFRLAGWRDAHDLISARTKSLVGKVKLEQTGMAGEATLSGSGRSCADSYSEAVRKRIERWMKMLMRQMTPKMAGNFQDCSCWKTVGFFFGRTQVGIASAPPVLCFRIYFIGEKVIRALLGDPPVNIELPRDGK
jgi:hypothetical protein